MKLENTGSSCFKRFLVILELLHFRTIPSSLRYSITPKNRNKFRNSIASNPFEMTLIQLGTNLIDLRSKLITILTYIIGFLKLLL